MGRFNRNLETIARFQHAGRLTLWGAQSHLPRHSSIRFPDACAAQPSLPDLFPLPCLSSHSPALGRIVRLTPGTAGGAPRNMRSNSVKKWSGDDCGSRRLNGGAKNDHLPAVNNSPVSPPLRWISRKSPPVPQNSVDLPLLGRWFRFEVGA